MHKNLFCSNHFFPRKPKKVVEFLQNETKNICSVFDSLELDAKKKQLNKTKQMKTIQNPVLSSRKKTCIYLAIKKLKKHRDAK